MALKINDLLTAYLKDLGIELIDFKLEFGRFQRRNRAGGRNLAGYLPFLGQQDRRKAG